MTFYVVRLTASAVRDLARLPEKIAAAIVEFMSGPLREQPYRVGKPLTGDHVGMYSARRGVYRIIYRIFEAVIEVEVTRIKHRREAYRPT